MAVSVADAPIVIVRSAPALALGPLLFETITVELLVHPFAGSVTVTV